MAEGAVGGGGGAAAPVVGSNGQVQAPRVGPVSGPRPGVSDATEGVGGERTQGAKGQEGGGERAQPTKSERPEARAEPQLHEVKVNGKKMRVTTEQLVQLAQKAEGANERFQKAAQTEKLAERLLQDLQSDPDRVLAAIGVDTDKFWQERLANKAKQELLSPEERARRQLEQERDAYKQKFEQHEQRTRAEKQQALQRQVSEQYERQMVDALKKAQLNDPRDLERMAEIGIEAIELGVELTPEQLAAEVRHRRSEELGGLKGHLATLDGPALVDFLGKDLVKKVLRATLEGVRRPGQDQARAPEPALSQDSPRKSIDTKEMNGNLRKLGIPSNIFLG